MTAIFRWMVCLLLAMGGVQGCDDSNDSPLAVARPLTQAELAAIAVLELEIEGRNKGDPDLLKLVNNFPMVRLSSGTVVILPDSETYRAIEEKIIIPSFLASEWDHSEFEELQVIHVSPTKVHVAAMIARYDSDNTKYLNVNTLWIVTKQDDHWGAKIRSSWAPVPGVSDGGNNVSDGENYAEAESAAINVLMHYIEARNNRDSEALAALNHYPRINLEGPELKVFQTPEEYIVFEENTVIHGLDYAEWDHSELSGIEVIQSGADKVHLAANCDNFDVMSEECSSQTGLWVIIKIDDRWGIRAHSYF